MSNGYNANGQHPAYQLGRDLLQLATLVFTFYAAHASSRNYDKIEDVERKQEVAASKASAVKDRFDAKQDEEIRALGIQLYTAWKYLEDVAAQSGNVRDVLKAAEAKKAYFDHVTKYNVVRP